MVPARHAPNPDPIGARPRRTASDRLSRAGAIDGVLTADRDASIGALLAELRLAAGKSQLRLAEQLCAASGVPTVTRHEISRWEREERVPSRFWLGWLAMVLDAPLDALEQAAAATRERRTRQASTADRLAWLDRPGADPTSALRRADDLVGGADLVPLVHRELRRTLAALPTAGSRGRPVVVARLAQLAQLYGWVAADAGAGHLVGGALRTAVRAAVGAGDEGLVGLALATAAQLHADSDPAAALRIARAGYERAGQCTRGTGRAVLLHRIAYAAARAGARGECEQALALADRAYDRRGGGDPAWAYWLDDAELTAMTGRCFAALGRPRLATPLLTSALSSRRLGGRSAALYAAWLAAAALDSAEVERACALAGEALLAGVRVGSVRAVDRVAALHPRLAAHSATPAVRRYAALVVEARAFLPGPPKHLEPGPAAHGGRIRASVEP